MGTVGYWNQASSDYSCESLNSLLPGSLMMVKKLQGKSLSVSSQNLETSSSKTQDNAISVKELEEKVPEDTNSHFSQLTLASVGSLTELLQESQERVVITRHTLMVKGYKKTEQG